MATEIAPAREELAADARSAGSRARAQPPLGRLPLSRGAQHGVELALRPETLSSAASPLAAALQASLPRQAALLLSRIDSWSVHHFADGFTCGFTETTPTPRTNGPWRISSAWRRPPPCSRSAGLDQRRRTSTRQATCACQDPGCFWSIGRHHELGFAVDRCV